MDAKELRIGNSVYYHISDEIDSRKEWDEISTIDAKDLEWLSNHDDPDYKPIPLTEEWLTKFGFNSKYKSVHVHWNLSGFGLEQASDVDDDGNSIPQKQVFYYEFVYEIKFVHQLQNLYFALRGEELTIKE
jgi:hypothetical protein